jgi:hypothetical protein
MTDDEKALWSKVTVRQPIDELIQHGPTIAVVVSAVDGGPSFKALAQFDTGAAGTGISKPLALKLALKPIAWGGVHQPGFEQFEAPYFRARIALPIGDIETDVVGLVTLDPPHDVLIGRDVLKYCRLTIDFTTGLTEFRIKKQI